LAVCTQWSNPHSLYRLYRIDGDGTIRAGRDDKVRETMSALADLPLLASGKVREMYELGEELLMVASDRISTYDAVHPTPIPDKGKVLSGLSVFWFGKTEHILPNHLVSAREGVPGEVRGRALVVRKLKMLPVECVVRGYITGSGWKDYRATGAVSGIELPAGLRESERLGEPIFTPSTKAETGHDEAIDFERAAELVGDRALMERVAEVSIALYSFAAEHARECGVILADTKFEFGLDENDPARPLVVGDEVLTPDSSRYWPADGFELGRGQPSFDKQYVRDWAANSGWDKRPPAPGIPEDVVAGTRARYVEAYERITGEPFQAWLDRTAADDDEDPAAAVAGIAGDDEEASPPGENGATSGGSDS
jgi:phosphoribosylaminoimidazole-succinocarboxamide synthase